MRYGWVYGIGLSLLVVILLLGTNRKDGFKDFKDDLTSIENSKTASSFKNSKVYNFFTGCSPPPYSDYITNTYTPNELAIWKTNHWDTLGQDDKNAEIATWDATDCATQKSTIKQNNIEMTKRLAVDNTGSSSL